MKIFKLIVLAGYMTTGLMGTAMAVKLPPQGSVTFGLASESVPEDAPKRVAADPSGPGKPPRSDGRRVRFADSSVAAERLDQAIAALSDSIDSFAAVDQESLNLKRQLVLIYNRLVTIKLAMGSSDGARQ